VSRVGTGALQPCAWVVTSLFAFSPYLLTLPIRRVSCHPVAQKGRGGAIR